MKKYHYLRAERNIYCCGFRIMLINSNTKLYLELF